MLNLMFLVLSLLLVFFFKCYAQKGYQLAVSEVPHPSRDPSYFTG